MQFVCCEWGLDLLTIAIKQDSYRLFKEFLCSNYPSFSGLNSHEMDNMLEGYSRKKGFSSPGDFGDHLYSLPYLEMLREIKLMVVELFPRPFFSFDPQWKVLNRMITDEEVWSKDLFEHKKDLLPTKLQSQPETLNILEVETAYGQGIYSALTRFAPILQKALKFTLLALESDEILLDQAMKNRFHRTLLQDVPDQDMTLNFEEIETDYYRFASEYAKMIKFVALDILREDISLIRDDKYNLILCGNLPYLYPTPVVRKIIEKIIPYLKLDGYLFMDFPDGKLMEFEGLEPVRIDGVAMYKRNRKAFKSKIDEVIERTHDSIENIINFVNYYVGRRQTDRVIEELEKITQKRWKSPVLFHLSGDLHLMRGQKHDALNRYSKAVMASKSFIPSYFNMILLNLINGSHSEACAVNERLESKLRISDFSTGKFGDYFKISSEGILDYSRQLSEAVRHEDSLSLESIVLEVMRAQGNENIIPIQTGVFKSLLMKRSGRGFQEPVQYQQQARVMFLDNFSHGDFSKLIKERSGDADDSDGEESPAREMKTPEDPAEEPESREDPVEFRPRGASPESFPMPHRKPRINIDMAIPSVSAMVNQGQREKEAGNDRLPSASGRSGDADSTVVGLKKPGADPMIVELDPDFIRDTEKMLDLGDFDGIISMIDRKGKVSNRSTRQMYRVLYKFCARAMKLSRVEDRLQKVIVALQELVMEND